MTGVVLVIFLAFVTPQGGVETRRIERPVANAQACAVALANLKPIDFRPGGPLLHFEASCRPAVETAPAPQRAPRKAGPLAKSDA